MSAQTKIVVLHMKEVIYTAIFVGLGILLVILLLYMFRGDNGTEAAASEAVYTAGVYSSSVMCGSNAVDVQVTVDENKITSVSLVNLDETVATMYPLVEPAMEQLGEQVLKKQSTEGITYGTENRYTSQVLLRAIEDALAKARIEQ